MKKLPFVLVLAVVSHVAAAESSDDAVGSVGIAGNLSTLGAGVTIGFPMTPNVSSLRVVGNYWNHKTTRTYSDVGTVDIKVKLATAGVLLDNFPEPESQFRYTVGLLINGNQSTAVGSPVNGNYTINGVTYSAATVGTLSSTVKFRPLAPYLGVGWGDIARDDKGFVFGADLGAMYQGTGKVVVSVSNPTGDPTLASNTAQAQTQAQQRIDKYHFYPVVGFSLGYRF